MNIFKKFNADKLRMLAKMAATRLGLVIKKKENSIKVHRRETAQLLAQKKFDSARIRVEHILHEEDMKTACEILQVYCQLLEVRVTLIASEREIPVDMKECLASVIFAGPRVEIQELLGITEQIKLKYGEEFVLECARNRDFCVNSRIWAKLEVKVPEPELCIRVLKTVAEEFKVEWNDEDWMTFPTHPPSISNPNPASGFSSAPPMAPMPPMPPVDTMSPYSGGLPPPPSGGFGGGMPMGQGFPMLPPPPLGQPPVDTFHSYTYPSPPGYNPSANPSPSYPPPPYQNGLPQQPPPPNSNSLDALAQRLQTFVDKRGPQ